MRPPLTSFALSALLLLALSAPARGERVAASQPGAAVGKEAPGFELVDTDGKKVSLASLRGRTVVLEWFNADCPFVKYAHGGGPLDGMAERWAKKNVTWLAINSNAPGKQGSGRDRNAKARADWKLPYPVLLDENGAVGKAYGARTTPHMYVIDARGILVYAGGLDNAPLGTAEGGTLLPYVEQALEAVTSGKPVKTRETKPYGCSVKYVN
jgi:peroxiredoxin